MEDIKDPEQSSPYDFPEDPIPDQYKRAMALDKQQVRTLNKKHLFLVAYEKNMGNISKSCQSAGIDSRKTFYNWCDTDPEFKKAINSAHGVRRDLVEDIVMIKIMKNHGQTIRWWLSKKHPDYKKRRGPTIYGPGAPVDPFKKYRKRTNYG